MTKLPLPSGISWLCHLCAPNCGRVSRIVHAGMCRLARDWQLGVQCECVCVCQQRDAARCKVWPSAALLFRFFFFAEVHVAKCPRRQTTLSLSLNCMLCLFVFFFFCIVVWGQSCIFAHCGNTIRCDSYSSVVSQSNHIESFHVNYLFGASFLRRGVVTGSHAFFF